VRDTRLAAQQYRRHFFYSSTRANICEIAVRFERECSSVSSVRFVECRIPIAPSSNTLIAEDSEELKKKASRK
jgi:hypothetical protein